MFTGIIEKTGRVLKLERKGANGKALEISVETGFSDLELGESVAVNGVCLTVNHWAGTTADFYLSPETLTCTALDSLKPGDTLNLERSLTLNRKISGHWVLGHVDGIAKLKSVREENGSHYLEISVPQQLLPFCPPKGSIALDGVSLTINSVDVAKSTISICIIPHTWNQTRFHSMATGDSMNAEADYLAKLAFHQTRFRDTGELIRGGLDGAL